MKKRNNPFTENISITVSSDRAKKKPLCILIKRYLLVFVLLVFAAALSAGTFAGISAYLSVSRLSSTVDDLQMLVAWQASALSEADVMAGAAFSGQAGALDWINLGPITGDEISAETSDDAARMSDPWLEVEATADISTIELQSGSLNGRVELLSWFDGGAEAFPRLTEAVVIDVETGQSFDVRRISGSYHADSEPLDSEDAAVLKKIYGGKWSWDRRAIWVKIEDRYFAASMNGMPHSSNYTSGNNFNGHFCIHFFRSRVHETSAQCPVHQKKVIEAYSQAELLEDYLLKNIY